jgi:hypothetical protein
VCNTRHKVKDCQEEKKRGKAGNRGKRSHDTQCEEGTKGEEGKGNDPIFLGNPRKHRNIQTCFGGRETNSEGKEHPLQTKSTKDAGHSQPLSLHTVSGKPLVLLSNQQLPGNRRKKNHNTQKNKKKTKPMATPSLSAYIQSRANLWSSSATNNL